VDQLDIHKKNRDKFSHSKTGSLSATRVPVEALVAIKVTKFTPAVSASVISVSAVSAASNEEKRVELGLKELEEINSILDHCVLGPEELSRKIKWAGEFQRKMVSHKFDSDCSYSRSLLKLKPAIVGSVTLPFLPPATVPKADILMYNTEKFVELLLAMIRRKTERDSLVTNPKPS
jgi:hypothetical protein